MPEVWVVSYEPQWNGEERYVRGVFSSIDLAKEAFPGDWSEPDRWGELRCSKPDHLSLNRWIVDKYDENYYGG